MKNWQWQLTQLLLSQLVLLPLTPTAAADSDELAPAPLPTRLNLDGKNLSLLEMPPCIELSAPDHCQATVGCDGNTGPKTTPHRVINFAAAPAAASTKASKTTRVILDQVFNTIEPEAVWTASTTAATNSAAYTITQPGKYILTGDLQINALNSPGVGNGVIGIAIASSNVTLDLNGYTISQSTNSVNAGVLGVIGILVRDTDSYYNITIQNGQISNIGNNTLQGKGILVGSGEDSYRLYDITLDNLRITKCGATGIALNIVNDSRLTNVSVTGCTNNLTGTALTTYGLSLTDCNNITVSDASFCDLNTTASASNASATYGIFIDRGTNLSFTNCATDYNVSSSSSGTTTTYGVYANNDSDIFNNLSFTNCSASNNVTARDTNLAGFRIGSSSTAENTISSITFTNCTANNNQTTGGSDANVVSGFWLYYCKGIKLSNCLASYNYSPNGTAIGFNLSNVQTGLSENCTALAQTSDSATTTEYAAGLLVDNGCTYIIVDKGIYAGQSASNKAYGIYFGNGSSAGPTRCVVKNCQLYNNIGTNGSFGFKDFQTPSATAHGSSTTLINNLAYGQGKINPSTGNLASGLDNANYMIQYAVPPYALATPNASDIFTEGTLTAIGAVPTDGLGTNFINVSVIS